MFNSIVYLPKLKEFEGAIPYMYLDTGGNVTVGVGNLLASANDAKQLGFVRRADPAAKPDAVITTLLNGRVTEFKAKLVAAFPDFDSYPDEACAALFDMGFNLGVPGLTSKFPTLCKAVKDKDWATAAKECHRASPVNDDRNDWTKAQFEKAAADAKAVPTGPK